MERLRAEYRIELEMALDSYAVAMTGPGNDDAMSRRLAEALLELDERFGPAQEEAPCQSLRTLSRPVVMGIEEAARVPKVNRSPSGRRWAG